MDDVPVFECRGLFKRYGGNLALDGVDLTLAPGRLVGLLGPNGSGKTTLIKLAVGLLQPSAGEIRVCGRPVSAESKVLTSYLPDRSSLDPWLRLSGLLSLYEDFFPDFHRERAETMFSDLGLNLASRFKSLSKGNREKVQLVLTMARQARLYLLDEPIGGVDPATRDYIMHAILTNYRRETSTLLISTHLLSDVESILDDVIFLKQGRVDLFGEAEEIREREGRSIDELFREVFKC